MKHLVLSALFLCGAAVFFAAPASAGCSTCQIQTKTAGAGGQFNYRISCIDDSSGDEKVANLTAAGDDAAVKAAQAKCD